MFSVNRGTGVTQTFGHGSTDYKAEGVLSKNCSALKVTTDVLYALSMGCLEKRVGILYEDQYTLIAVTFAKVFWKKARSISLCSYFRMNLLVNLQRALVFICSSICLCQAVYNASQMMALLKSIKMELDPSVPPIETDLPVNVSAQLSIIDMFPYQSSHMHYSADFYLKLRWYDYRLAFDKSDNVSFIPVNGGLIWKPDIFFPKGRQGQLQKVPFENEGSHIYLNGTVVHVLRITLVSICAMEFHFYPFDIQNCTFEISTMTHNKQFVRLHWDRVPILQRGPNLLMKEFNIVKFSTAISTDRFGRNGEFDKLEVHFRFFRYLAFYFLRDFFPCILIVVLSWMTFWIDYESTPARVAMGITTVLTVVTMTNNVRNHSPPTGLFRSIDYYLLMCNLFVFAALLEYALVGLFPRKKIAKIDAKNEKKKKKTEDIDLYNFNGAEDWKETFAQSKIAEEESNETLQKKHTRRDHRIDKISRVLFPAMFALFNAIYFAFHRLHKETVD